MELYISDTVCNNIVQQNENKHLTSCLTNSFIFSLLLSKCITIGSFKGK